MKKLLLFVGILLAIFCAGVMYLEYSIGKSLEGLVSSKSSVLEVKMPNEHVYFTTLATSSIGINHEYIFLALDTLSNRGDYCNYQFYSSDILYRTNADSVVIYNCGSFKGPKFNRFKSKIHILEVKDYSNYLWYKKYMKHYGLKEISIN